MSMEVEERPQHAIQALPLAAGQVRAALPGWKLVAFALSTSLLLWLCHFPVAWGWLGWVALVPLLFLVRVQASKKRLFLAAWLGGLAFFWPTLAWMRVADYRMYATWALLATYCSFYVPAAIGLIHYLDRRTAVPLIVSVPVVWTALEYARSFLLSGFAWYYLGHTQHDFPVMIQIADLTGAYGVTFVLTAGNAWLFELLWSRPAVRRYFGGGESRCCCLVIQSVAVVVLVAGTLGYGIWRLGQDEFEAGPRVALIQSNLDQRLRNEVNLGGNAAKTMFLHNGLLSSIAVRQALPPDLIVWSETSCGYEWTEIAANLAANQIPAEWADAVKDTVALHKLLAGWKSNMLVGLNSQELDADGLQRRYNTALMLRSDGTVTGRYHKMHRVPFGEFVPFRDWLPWMDAVAPYDYDYSIRPGESFTRFALGNHRFGVIICYEDSDPVLPRQYVADDPVDFLVNISNDGWFDGTSEHDEHLAICRFRAVECRRAVVRAVNMGISAIIDGNGQVREPDLFVVHDEAQPSRRVQIKSKETLPVPEWRQYKQTAGVLIAAVPLDTRESLYARWGDWLPMACWLVLGVGMVVGRMRK